MSASRSAALAPPRRVDQPGGHQQLEQIQRIIDHGGLLRTAASSVAVRRGSVNGWRSPTSA